MVSLPSAPKRGIIPACAGSTLVSTATVVESGDHPRMCGEHVRKRTNTPIIPGSSPHVRGAPANSILFRPTHGIIPACAGSTPTVRGWSRLRWDHPRMCGEHLSTVLKNSENEGSSPHVRGAPNVRPLAGKGDGIIPACAGSTYEQAEGGVAVRDHPRMCGEHTSKIA